jgi:sec-independent protein translocase protein TatA
MFGFGMPELIIIMVILLLVVGPGKLPQLGASLGGAIRSFKRASEEDTREIPEKGHEEK